MLGKWKATVQFVALALAMIRPDVIIAGAYLDQWVLVIAAIVTVWSGVRLLRALLIRAARAVREPGLRHRRQRGGGRFARGAAGGTRRRGRGPGALARGRGQAVRRGRRDGRARRHLRRRRPRPRHARLRHGLPRGGRELALRGGPASDAARERGGTPGGRSGPRRAPAWRGGPHLVVRDDRRGDGRRSAARTRRTGARTCPCTSARRPRASGRRSRPGATPAWTWWP